MIFENYKDDPDIILGLAINAQNDTGLVIWDLKNSKIIPLKISELEPLRFPSICKIAQNLYFITGGLINKTELTNQSWVFNSYTQKLFATNNSPIACYDSYLIKNGNKVFSVSGKKSPSKLINNFSYYSFVHMEWFELPSINFEIRGIKSIFFDENEDLFVLLYSKKLIKFSFAKNIWEEVKTFTYDFSKFFVTNNDKCILFNDYHHVIYDYDFSTDSIKTKFLLDDMEISDCFYIQERDSIIFVDNVGQQMFVVYNCKNNTLKYFDSDVYKKMFGELKWFRSFHNLKIDSIHNKQEIKIPKIDLQSTAFIFGNFHYPFKLTLDLKNETISHDFIPESLHLKQEQGVDYYDDKNLLFVGGYDDEVSYHVTSDCYVYNPVNNNNSLFPKLSYQLGDCYIQKITHNDKNIFFVISSRNEIQYFDDLSKSWKDTASINLENILPISLGIADKLIIFYTQDLKSPNQSLVFQQYDIENKKWIEIYKKKTENGINLKFCKPLDENSFLVIFSGKTSENLQKMTLKKNGDVIEDVIFEDIGALTMYKIKAYILSYCVYNDIIIFMFVNSQFVLEFVGYDIKTNTIIRNDKVLSIQKLVKDSLFQMRLERYLWTFGTFSVIGKNM